MEHDINRQLFHLWSNEIVSCIKTWSPQCCYNNVQNYINVHFFFFFLLLGCTAPTLLLQVNFPSPFFGNSTYYRLNVLSIKWASDLCLPDRILHAVDITLYSINYMYTVHVHRLTGNDRLLSDCQLNCKF